jgi:hypothetical protein
MTDYETQAQAFLSAFGLTLAVNPAGDGKAPLWTDKGQEHGEHYRVTIGRQSEPDNKITFDFWGSILDKRQGTHPTAYDVLAYIAGDVHCPDTFEEFCSEYGYSEDSRKAEATFRHAYAFACELGTFLTEEEIDALSEIR